MHYFRVCDFLRIKQYGYIYILLGTRQPRRALSCAQYCMEPFGLWRRTHWRIRRQSSGKSWITFVSCYVNNLLRLNIVSKHALHSITFIFRSPLVTRSKRAQVLDQKGLICFSRHRVTNKTASFQTSGCHWQKLKHQLLANQTGDQTWDPSHSRLKCVH